MKRKEKIAIALVVALFTAGLAGSAVFAQNQAGGNKDKKDETATTTKKIETLAEKRQRYISRLGDLMSDKIEKLDKVFARISTRISNLEMAGYQMSEPKKLLSEAAAKIAEAKKSLENLKVSFNQAIQALSTNPVPKLTKVREDAKKTRDAIKAAHSALVKVIASIKQGIRKGKDTTATSTPKIGGGNAATSTATTTNNQ